RGKLAELVPDHVLGHVQLDEVLAVVDGKVLADELGHDRAGPRPGPDRLAIAGLIGLVHPLEQPLDDVRAFIVRTSYSWSLSNLQLSIPDALAAADDGGIRGLAAAAGLPALGQLARGRAGMPAAGGPSLAAAHRMIDGVHRHAPHV